MKDVLAMNSISHLLHSAGTVKLTSVMTKVKVKCKQDVSGVCC